MKIELELGEYVPHIPDPEHVLNLIRTVGFWRLTGGDGCLCGHLSLTNISVQVSCHKSGSSISVECASCASPDHSSLRRIADEIMRQITVDCEPEVAEWRRRNYKINIGSGCEYST